MFVNTTRCELEETISDKKELERITRNNILKLSLCALTSTRPVRVNKADKYIINCICGNKLSELGQGKE